MLQGEAMGETRVRILHLEDDRKDAELVQAALEAEGLPVTVEVAASREDFMAAIGRGQFRLILSDYAVPGFDGISALRVAQDTAPEVPFILVSGTLGEEAAAESIKSGATDFVLKHRLGRLGPSVRRALAEAAERRKRQQAEEALHQSEAQLRQAQKMEAIGQLAGGVAHDFNNLLTAIMGYGQIMRSRIIDAKAERDLDEILKAADRAAALTRQLLAFSRQQVLDPKVLDLNRLITDMDKMLQRLIGEDIDLATMPGGDLGRVKADPGQIEQVVMNLVVNARDAMPRGGKLTIETANVDLNEDYIGARQDLRSGPHVMVAVSDTGCGMTPEVRSRIFEPFFTTKEIGRGTGLGLSTVHGIVKQSGGHVEVYSEVGLGTTFKIYLPRVDEQAGTLPQQSADHDRYQGHETVLVVEDDEMIRRVIGESLRLQGYTVLEAADGSEAITLCEQERQPIDILVTDVVMPLMSGPELAQRLHSIRPDLPILFISGYTDRALLHQGQRHSGTAFLQKPFTPETLARKIREILGQPGQQAA
jgi:two-component system, cell cycle sensor histidine kinase and response regulator CckA